MREIRKSKPGGECKHEQTRVKGDSKSKFAEDPSRRRDGPSVHKQHTRRLRLIRDFANIYRWRETWIPVGFALSVTGTWFWICLALNVPNPYRSIMIYGLLCVLGLGAAVMDPEGRR